MAKAENLLIALEGIFSSRFLKKLATSLQQRPTELAVNWSNWFSKNVGLPLKQFNNMSIFTRIRLFRRFIKEKRFKLGLRKKNHLARLNLIMVGELYRYFKEKFL